MDWTNHDSLELIEQYRLHTELWDRSDPKYKDKMCRFRGWSEVADRFGCTKAEVERKMNVLLTQYRREKHKMLMKRYEGMQPGTSKWYAFKNFAFLETSNAAGAGGCGMGFKSRKRRDMQMFQGMRLGLPLLMASGQNSNPWNTMGPFSPTMNHKQLSNPFPLPLTSSLSAENLLRLQQQTQQRTDTETAGTDADESKDNDRQMPGSPFSPKHKLNHDDHDISDELDIKPELSDFLHPAHPDSNRSYTPSGGGEDNRNVHDDFAQDLRITSSRNLEFGYDSREQRRQSTSMDSKESPTTAFKRHCSRFSTGDRSQREDSDKDDCDYIGSNVTVKLRTMDKTQRIIAEKLISEILFYGQFNELDKTAKVHPK